MKNKILLIGALIFSVNILFAQKTMIFSDSYKNYRDAQELFDKSKYSAAQNKFGKVIEEINNPQDELRVDSEFYHAVCALELFHLDAEILLKRFVSPLAIATSKYSFLKGLGKLILYQFDLSL